MSIGGESIPFTMQGEVSHMTLDEAIASGLFDMSDEPDVVRIPISIPNLHERDDPDASAATTRTAGGGS